MSDEKALKLIRETCAGIAETHGKLTADRVESVLKPTIEEFIRIAGGEFTSYTVRSWLEAWIAGRTDASKATLTEYKHIIELFLKFLGARADRALTTLQPRQVEDFKGKLTARVGPSTVNKAVKILRAAFNAAVKARQLEFNPAQHVEFVKTDHEDGQARRPFTAGELSALLTHANAEWRTMILTAFYTGLRLRDCANLTWRNVELQSGTLNVMTKKTKRQQVLPLAEPLARHFSNMAGDDPNAALCPNLRGKPPGWLSNQFYQIMADADIVEKREHQSEGKGRDARRKTSPVSFHSLRYNCTSALKSSGVSDAVAMDIVGHETASVSRNYTKIDDTAKRAAINKLPDITK